VFRLNQAGKVVLVPAGPPLMCSKMLVSAQGEVVEGEKIMQTVWLGKTVEDANLAVQHRRDAIDGPSIG
jgi:DNA-binding winged helix-turn-helix (wHTH) protein